MKFHNLLRRITLFIFCLLMLIFNAATQELSEQDTYWMFFSKLTIPI